MASTLTESEEAQLAQTIEMFEVITESQPHDYQSLEILKEAYSKLGRDNDVVKTAKRIAEAYVDMGQLSSAILEYETILQRCPDDFDVQKALKQIESKANNFSQQAAPSDTEISRPSAAQKNSKAGDRNGAAKIDDGRQTFYKIFVESKIISAGDFDLCWVPAESVSLTGIVEPFVQILADKGILQIEKSLKLLSDKSRAAFLPLDKYDVDIDLTRGFPAQICQRWCILPFDRMSKSVLVATANPYNQQAAKELAAATPYRLLWYLTPPSEIVKVLQKAFR
jgi:tetratricopeptide (TPR) repeat protein